MKVALVAQSVDVRRGGAETSTLQFIGHLLRAGVDVHLITQGGAPTMDGLIVHAVGGATRSRTLAAVRFTRRVEQLLRVERFDLVHAISPCRMADIYQPRGGTVRETILRNLALRRTLAGQLLKHMANSLNFKQRYVVALERCLLGNREGPLVIAISEYVARQFRTHYNLPEARIRKVFNGVDPSPTTLEESVRNRHAIRREFGIGDDDCLVLSIAHNFRLKGIARWMETLVSLIRRGTPKVRSLVIGRGPTGIWQRKAERLGLAGSLTFAGPRHPTRPFHDAADLLVHPTYYDPCSRVVLEAMTAGLPCITTRWDGASEMVEDGQNGFIIDDPGNTTALADRVDRLRDVTLRRRIGRAAKEVAKRVSMKRHAAEMLAIYDELSNVGRIPM